jgi:hypothetical protein
MVAVGVLRRPGFSVMAQQTLQAQDAKSPQQAPVENRSVQPAPPVSQQSYIKFEDAIDRSGIQFQLRNSVSPQKYYIETMLGGVAVFDYNNDGLQDIFFTNGAQIPSLEKSDPSFYNRLYRNNGDGTFTDVTEKAGVKGVGYSMGVAAGDYDNDGFVDLYVVGVNRNQLLHNNGDGTFTDVTEKAGVSGEIPGEGKPWAVAAGWFDYNNDGLLDLLVINYLDYNIQTAKPCSIDGVRTYCAPGNFKGTANILYRNNGDGTFTDVSKSSHISQYIGKGMARISFFAITAMELSLTLPWRRALHTPQTGVLWLEWERISAIWITMDFRTYFIRQCTETLFPFTEITADSLKK